MEPYRTSPPPSPSGPSFCFYCAGAFRGGACSRCHLPDTAHAETADVLWCAKQHGPLQRHSLGVANAHVCNTCQGMFVTGPEWDLLIAEMHTGARPDLSRVLPPPPSMSAPPSMESVRCSSCKLPMDRGTFALKSKIVIDVCPSHGVWFDATELVGVVEIVRRRIEGQETVDGSERMTQAEIDAELARMRQISMDAIQHAHELMERFRQRLRYEDPIV